RRDLLGERPDGAELGELLPQPPARRREGGAEPEDARAMLLPDLGRERGRPPRGGEGPALAGHAEAGEHLREIVAREMKGVGEDERITLERQLAVTLDVGVG